MRALILSSILILSACSGIPSFYDDNESLLAIDVRMAVHKLDCSDSSETAALKDSIKRLSLYSESKNSSDIYPLINKMEKTSEGIETSKAVCSLKKKILAKQSADIANAVMRRF